MSLLDSTSVLLRLLPIDSAGEEEKKKKKTTKNEGE
jgi:hypothetical protein